MNNLQNRANAVLAFSISATFALLAAIALSSLFIPSNPSGSVTLNSLEVHAMLIAYTLFSLTGRYDRTWFDYKTRDNEFAHTMIKVDADLSSLFNWNTKQLFVYIVAEYSTPTHPKNEIVLWDAIIKSKSRAVIRKKNLASKYSVIDVNRKWT
ncbi:hypothetical protein BGX31_004240 [Mortierella sp. GBA43]|nr:hypothetical protein BGX31_004240 [Mortierella sp. GBA43]